MIVKFKNVLWQNLFTESYQFTKNLDAMLNVAKRSVLTVITQIKI